MTIPTEQGWHYGREKTEDEALSIQAGIGRAEFRPIFVWEENGEMVALEMDAECMKVLRCPALDLEWYGPVPMPEAA